MAPKNQHICWFCILHRLEVIERAHLVSMATLDLKYYARRKSLSFPINGLKDDIIDVILADQAKDLTARARLALSQVSGDINGAAMLDPYVSSYSMAGRTVGGRTVGGRTAGGATEGVESSDDVAMSTGGSGGDVDRIGGGVTDTPTTTLGNKDGKKSREVSEPDSLLCVCSSTLSG